MMSIDQLKQLREETGISIAECRKALIEAEGDEYSQKGFISRILSEIEGVEGAEFVLKKALRSQTKEESKERIESALTRLR